MSPIKALTIIAITLLPSLGFCSGGMYDQYVIVNTGSNAYFGIGGAGNPDFNGAVLGTFDLGAGATLSLGGQGKSYKNSGTDVTGMSLQYRIYTTGSPSGSVAALTYNFQIDNVGGTSGNQQWGTDVAGANGSAFYTSNLISGLANGNYTIEVYSQIGTNSNGISNPYLNDNLGSFYKASFTVTPEPSRASFALLGLGAMIFRRRRK